MQRCFLAAEAGQPPSALLQQSLSAAEAQAWADPSLRAHEGRVTRSVLDAAIASVAASVGAADSEVTFLPGRDSALRWAAANVGKRGPLAVGIADRKVVLAEAERRTAHLIDVDDNGRLILDDAVEALCGDSQALCCQVGNPEVGTLQPLADLHRACKQRAIPLLLDATMAAGRTPLPHDWDALVLDARSWGGGDDVAMVVRRPSALWRTEPASSGIGSWPAGAPAIARCAAAALTLERTVADVEALALAQRATTDRLRTELAEIPDVVVHGSSGERLPHIVSFSALYIDAEALLLELDRAGISVASGSACAAEDGQPSHVLAAMGALTSGNLRVSLPLQVQPECVDRLLSELPSAIAALRAEAGL